MTIKTRREGGWILRGCWFAEGGGSKLIKSACKYVEGSGLSLPEEVDFTVTCCIVVDDHSNSDLIHVGDLPTPD